MSHARITVGLRETILLLMDLIVYMIIVSISNHVYDGRTMQSCDPCTTASSLMNVQTQVCVCSQVLVSVSR